MTNIISYQYNMEEIINRLHKLQNLYNMLDESDVGMYENLNEQYNKDINDINNILDNMEKNISNLKFSKEKINNIYLNLSKEKNLTKMLFPYFWYFNNKIDNEIIKN